jgi:transposase
MIPVPSGVRVWLATGATDMRRGMNGLALQVQEGLGRDPHAGDLYVFRGKRGDLIKVLWHNGLSMSLYAKRLERGRFLWPSPADGVVPVTAAQLGYLPASMAMTPQCRFWPRARQRPADYGPMCGMTDPSVAMPGLRRCSMFGRPPEHKGFLHDLANGTSAVMFPAYLMRRK